MQKQTSNFFITSTYKFASSPVAASSEVLIKLINFLFERITFLFASTKAKIQTAREAAIFSLTLPEKKRSLTHP